MFSQEERAHCLASAHSHSETSTRNMGSMAPQAQNTRVSPEPGHKWARMENYKYSFGPFSASVVTLVNKRRPLIAPTMYYAGLFEVHFLPPGTSPKPFNKNIYQ